MAHSKLQSKHWGKALFLGAVLLAAPIQAGCEGDKAFPEMTSIHLGEPTEPRPGLTLTLAAPEAAGRTAEPLTLRSALLRSGLKLRLSDVTVSSAAVTGFRVFLNAPEGATDLTPEHPSFASSVAFFPAATPDTPAGTFVLDLDQALDRSLMRDDLRTDAPVALTLLPIGPDDAAIGLGGSELLSE